MDWSLLLFALMMVESGGNNQAVGDNGKAIGCLQIHAIVIHDVNRIHKTQFTLDDRLDRQKSLHIALLYLKHYGKAYKRKTRKPLTYEVIARIWNGGPDGWKKSATEMYWNRVHAIMNAEQTKGE